MIEEENFIFLDFNNRLASDTFEKDAFIRIANLHTGSPFVQTNDTLYKGSFDHAMGTNLFLEANLEYPEQTDIFIKHGPIQYEHVATTVKILSLKPAKVPPQKPPVSRDFRKIEFNLNWDYETLLDKFSDGSLKIQDILKDDVVMDNEKGDENEYPEEPEAPEAPLDIYDQNTLGTKNSNVEISEQTEDIIVDQLEVANVLEDYQMLRQLAFRPVRSCKEQEHVAECDPKYKEVYDYHNLERQIFQPCDFFRSEPVTEINEDALTLTNCVDVDRCILYGLLDKATSTSRVFTDEEKERVLTVDNFENISLAGRYYVLKNHIEKLEGYLKENKNGFDNTDVYGRTAKRTLEIYMQLADALRKHIQRLKHGLQQSDNDEQEVTNSNLGHCDDV